MQVNLLRQNKIYIVEQKRQNSKGISRVVQHCDYLYATMLPTDFGFDKAAALADALEEAGGFEIFNVRLVLDDMTGNWTLHCSSAGMLDKEYNLTIPD